MQANPFLSLAVVQLPSHARLLPSSWCPDKDLLAIVTRPRGKDRLSLYKMQGSKVWEVNFDVDGSTGDEEVVDIAWSPDCQTVAVAHKPPRVTLHSIQDGRQERAIPLASTSAAVGTAKAANPSGIWWFTQEKKESKSDIPDIFKRGFDITGSAHSILKGQALLDHLLDDSQPLTATDLFAFKQKPTRGVGSTIPAVIASWPTLPTDLLAASIQSAKIGGQRPRPGEDLDEVDLTNMDSVLAVADDAGNLHCFLDGSYPLGIVAIGPDIASMSLAKDNDLFFAHPRFTAPTITALRPFVIRLPHLQRRALRDVARVSSSVRELVWYTMRVVKDMRSAWFGGEAQSGARELGPKWIRALETRMKDEFGQEEPYAMLDLTSLLATGCATDALADYLGSGEQMTERGMQKWEQSMIEALVMLRDYSEKRVAPACQRLHLLLEEAYGWSLLPQYQLCGINTAQVNACMDLAGRAVLLAGWLAATARRELVRFTEFMFWLRYETTRLNTSGEGHHHPPVPRHDILEVNDYLMSGLVVSPIDRWFMGPVPQFSPHDLGVPGDWVDMKSTALRARRVLKEPRLSAWQYNIKQKDLSHLDRNLDSLVQELAVRSHRIFLEAANATARSAVLLSSVIPSHLVDTTLLRAVESNSSALIRERTVLRPGQAARYTQFLLIQLPRVRDRSYLCIARLHHGTERMQQLSAQVEVAVLECCIPVNDARDTRIPFDLLDAEFFDESVFIIVYREANQPGFASIATVGYGDLKYTSIGLERVLADYARETLIQEVLERLEGEQLSSEAAPLIQTRRLAGCREGKVSVAVNGRTGRRVACVLDSSGTALEILDIEGEEEETEVEDMSTVEADV